MREFFFLKYSATVANMVDEEKLNAMMRVYAPILNLSLVLAIANPGMPLDYRLIAGAGLFTVIYILSRAIGKVAFKQAGEIETVHGQ